MAEVKVSELTAAVTVVETDLFPATLDPAGTPISRKVTLKQILDKRLNYSIVASGDFTLVAGTAAQSAFSTTGDVFTAAAATTYEVEGMYHITKSGTTCTTSVLFALGGGATITSMFVEFLSLNGTINTTGTAQDLVFINQAAATVVAPTSVGNVLMRFKGIVRIATGGTVTPQIQFSAIPTTPAMKADSYIKFTPIGTNIENQKGTVA